MRKKMAVLIAATVLTASSLSAQTFVPNYDESLVPEFTLPNPLIFENGEKVKTAEDWAKRREEIFRLFEQEVYGVSPKWEGNIKASVVYENPDALDGLATLREIKLTLQYQDRELDVFVLLHLPKSERPVPLFLGYNFYGNHTTSEDPGVMVTQSWSMNNEAFGITENKATEASRGMRTSRWPAREIVSRGYGLATIYYGDVDPDFDDGFENGVHGLIGKRHKENSWGSIAAWAWGLSRVMDFFETYDVVDGNRVAVIGHSRLGKAALWAGAMDQRYAMVISNNSGCGGAALSMRRFGETVGRINTNFPHWFGGNYKKYNENEELLPVDQHQLLALIAPRPLYVASAEEDRWADPRGEFLASVEATPVYQLFGLIGLPVTEMPGLNQPVHGTIGYHIRPGVHDIMLYDWQQYMDFADKHFYSR
jgi:hypothetical protein